mmetsp:Transcript_55914/g.120984  ORF Transcript_55914/g.120984 Transcript_55914/m.120984 type:complete len:211 (-) Transcript_55914:1484-2116(-)
MLELRSHCSRPLRRHDLCWMVVQTQFHVDWGILLHCLRNDGVFVSSDQAEPAGRNFDLGNVDLAAGRGPQRHGGVGWFQQHRCVVSGCAGHCLRRSSNHWRGGIRLHTYPRQASDICFCVGQTCPPGPCAEHFRLQHLRHGRCHSSHREVDQRDQYAPSTLLTTHELSYTDQWHFRDLLDILQPYHPRSACRTWPPSLRQFRNFVAVHLL